jgi:hypothetical protein
LFVELGSVVDISRRRGWQALQGVLTGHGAIAKCGLTVASCKEPQQLSQRKFLRESAVYRLACAFYCTVNADDPARPWSSSAVSS